MNLEFLSRKGARYECQGLIELGCCEEVDRVMGGSVLRLTV